MKKEIVMNRYRYIGKDYTLVRFSKKGEKQRISHGEEFDSSCDPSLFRNFFIKLGKVSEEGTTETNETNETTETNQDKTLDLVELVQQYIEKFGKSPNKNWTEKTILSKLK